jgi:hypothetical protein
LFTERISTRISFPFTTALALPKAVILLAILPPLFKNRIYIIILSYPPALVKIFLPKVPPLPPLQKKKRFSFEGPSEKEENRLTDLFF